MHRWEYRILHMPTTSLSVLNERVNNDAREGWEPFMMSGNDFVNIIMRRPIEQGEVKEQN